MKNKLLLLVIGTMLSAQTLVAQVPSYVPTNGLVGYWSFNGNANDVSGNGNNGTNNGATLTTDRNGNTNSAYSFNGTSSFINVPNSSSLQFNGGITFSVWLNASNIPVGAVNSTSYLMSKGADGGTPYSWISYLDTAEIALRMWNNNNLNNGAVVTNSQFSITTNQWYNATFTFDGTNAKAYINGQLKSTVPATYTTFSNIYDLKFGRRHTSGLPYFFNGKLDDIGVWNRALTQTEITSLYTGVPQYSDTCNNVSGSLTQGLVGYWPFCGNSNDDSGNGNNGTVNGATLTTDRFGNSNSAYSFNGASNFIEVFDNNTLDISNNYTLAAWFKISDYSTITPSDPFCVILGKARQSGWASGYALYAVNGNTSNTYGRHQWGHQGSPKQRSSSASLDIWHNIICSYDGSNLNLYFDGVLIKTQTTTYTLANYSTPLFFGREFDNTTTWNRYFKGQLDDIGIWNRALTPSEVTQLYNQNQCITNITVTDTLIINVGQLSFNNPVTWANNITIAPNPASSQININFNNITNLNGGTLKVINSLGQEVATTPITTSGTQSVMQLATWGGSGMYYVQIINPQGIVVDVKKIILQ